jgi:hypothetical protein
MVVSYVLTTNHAHASTYLPTYLPLNSPIATKCLAYSFTYPTYIVGNHLHPLLTHSHRLLVTSYSSGVKGKEESLHDS